MLTIKHPARKGLGKGGVCLLQHYCPFCFKGKIGVAGGLCVAKGSLLIDEVQVLHSAKGNGLRPLDLKSPGEFCVNPALCRLVCLVCGKTTVDGEDTEFETFLEFFGGEDDHPLTTKYEIHEAMETHGLVWTEQWDTPVHKHCSKKMACKCVVPIGATVCPVHKRVLLKPAPPPCSAAPLPAPMPPSFKARAQEGTRGPTALIAGQGSALTKASWLPARSTIATAVTSFHTHNTVKVGKKAVPLAVKPTLLTERLKEAASACAFKIPEWTGTHPTNVKLDASRIEPGKKGQKFCLREHTNNFDELTDGAWLIKGVSWYKPHNGPLVLTPVGVNTLHEDGTMTPLVPV
jgi:hypothetical protein